MSCTHTIWEAGRQSGRRVVTLAALAVLAAVVLDLLFTGRATWFSDVAFVAICVAAALSVRARDFFPVGVLPPLLMFGTVLTLAVVARGAIAEEVDGLVQAVVSGLAHHAGGLTAGYTLTLAILAVRQATLQKRRVAVRTRSRDADGSSVAT